MPTRPTKGAKLVSYELPTELVEELKAFAARRGETAKDVVAQALKRHMANPPTQDLPPLPPVPAPAPAPQKKRGPKPKGGAA